MNYLNNSGMIPQFPMQMSNPMMNFMSNPPMNFNMMNPQMSMQHNFLLNTLLKSLKEYIDFLQQYLMYILLKGFGSFSIDFGSNYIQAVIDNCSKSINDLNNINAMGINDITTNYYFQELSKNLKLFLQELKSKLTSPSNYFEVNEIKIENDKIISKIEDKAYEFCELKETNELETVGNFLYSVGGIARKALDISNKIYYKKLEEFQKTDEFNNIFFNKEKNFSIWLKNNLNNEYFRDICEENLLNIFEYLQMCPKETKFLIRLFIEFLRLYFKCDVSIPFVEIEFLGKDVDKFDNSEMTDLIYKGKPTKVNFCYLPQLKSNGSVIKGAKFYVFTYIDGRSFKKETVNYEVVLQNVKKSI